MSLCARVLDRKTPSLRAIKPNVRGWLSFCLYVYTGIKKRNDDKSEWPGRPTEGIGQSVVLLQCVIRVYTSCIYIVIDE